MNDVMHVGGGGKLEVKYFLDTTFEDVSMRYPKIPILCDVIYVVVSQVFHTELRVSIGLGNKNIKSSLNNTNESLFLGFLKEDLFYIL